jgi:hypothetical protein
MPRGVVFHEDGRAVWRVSWTLAFAFGGVAGLMQRDGAALWPLFAGIALLLLGLGGSALLGRRRPLLGVEPEGLRVYAGRVGLGGRGDAGAQTLPWSAIERVGFEVRAAGRSRGEDPPITVEALCFHLAESSARPDGGRGFLAELAGRAGEQALGAHWVWRPAERSLDLLGRPRGGFADLTAAVARAEPRLGDASAGRRTGLGGAFAYAVYDLGLVLGLLAAVWLAATRHSSV